MVPMEAVVEAIIVQQQVVQEILLPQVQHKEMMVGLVERFQVVVVEAAAVELFVPVNQVNLLIQEVMVVTEQLLQLQVHQ